MPGQSSERITDRLFVRSVCSDRRRDVIAHAARVLMGEHAIHALAFVPSLAPATLLCRQVDAVAPAINHQAHLVAVAGPCRMGDVPGNITQGVLIAQPFNLGRPVPLGSRCLCTPGRPAVPRRRVQIGGEISRRGAKEGCQVFPYGVVPRRLPRRAASWHRGVNRVVAAGACGGCRGCRRACVAGGHGVRAGGDRGAAWRGGVLACCLRLRAGWHRGCRRRGCLAGGQHVE
mmetsp:Transcript_3068/g.11434  ORF Transcript_3068/g.11434 Transcript_3068/m.11434 type:complete len:231 (-) Transcript_3068:975-1667(-)